MHPPHISTSAIPPPHPSPARAMSPVRKPTRSRDRDASCSRSRTRSFQSRWTTSYYIHRGLPCLLLLSSVVSFDACARIRHTSLSTSVAYASLTYDVLSTSVAYTSLTYDVRSEGSHSENKIDRGSETKWRWALESDLANKRV